MATTETITTTYAGEHAGKYISAALLTADSIVNGAVSVMPNIKYQSVISKLDLSSIQADATCDFTEIGTVTLAERILTPKSLQVNMKLCKQNYRDTWEAISMGYSAHDSLPPSFAEYLIGLVAAQVAANNESNIWSGATGTSGEFNGLEVLLAANAAQAAGLELAGTTVTAANVVAQIASVIDAAPVALYNKPGFAVRIGSNIARHFKQAQAALGAFDAFYEREAGMNFLGTPLIVCPGMTDDVMIATYADNLFFGTGVLNDTNLVKVIDTADTLGDENVRIVMRFTAGTQFGNGEDVVTYGITNASN